MKMSDLRLSIFNVIEYDGNELPLLRDALQRRKRFLEVALQMENIRKGWFNKNSWLNNQQAWNGIADGPEKEARRLFPKLELGMIGIGWEVTAAKIKALHTELDDQLIPLRYSIAALDAKSTAARIAKLDHIAMSSLVSITRDWMSNWWKPDAQLHSECIFEVMQAWKRLKDGEPLISFPPLLDQVKMHCCGSWLICDPETELGQAVLKLEEALDVGIDFRNRFDNIESTGNSISQLREEEYLRDIESATDPKRVESLRKKQNEKRCAVARIGVLAVIGKEEAQVMKQNIQTALAHVLGLVPADLSSNPTGACGFNIYNAGIACIALKATVICDQLSRISAQWEPLTQPAHADVCEETVDEVFRGLRQLPGSSYSCF
jgi:hypothetical protein